MSAIPPLPAGYQLDQSSTVPPLPKGYTLDSGEPDQKAQSSLLDRAATQPSQFSHTNPLRYFDELGQGMAQGAEMLVHPVDTAKKTYEFMAKPLRDDYALMRGRTPEPSAPPKDMSAGDVADTIAQTWGQFVPAAVAGKSAAVLSDVATTAAGKAAGAAARVTPKQIAQGVGAVSGAVEGHGPLSMPGAYYGAKTFGRIAEALLGKDRANSPLFKSPDTSLDSMTDALADTIAQDRAGGKAGTPKFTAQDRAAAKSLLRDALRQAPADIIDRSIPASGATAGTNLLAKSQVDFYLKRGDVAQAENAMDAANKRINPAWTPPQRRPAPTVDDIRQAIKSGTYQPDQLSPIAPVQTRADSLETKGIQEQMRNDLEQHGWSAESEARREFIARNSTGMTKGELTRRFQGTQSQEGINATAPIRPDSIRATVPEKSAPSAEPAPGATTTIRVPGEANSYAATYQVRELDDVQPSHSGINFNPNPRYSLMNDRDYGNAVNQGKIIEASAPGRFDPAYQITDNPDATNGPIVVDSEGHALGGNGRTMILQRTYKYNSAGAQAYKDMLAQKAQQFGIDPARVQQMKQPVLVRQIDDLDLAKPQAKQNAVTDFNKKGTAELTPSERAISDSSRVSQATLDDLAGRLEDQGSNATLADVLRGKSGSEVIEHLISDGVLSPQERAALTSESGLTDAGKDRISGLLIGRFFRDSAQIDSTPLSLRNKLEKIAAPLAKLDRVEDWDLIPHVQQAVDLLEEVRQHGTNIEDFLQQRGLFGESKYPAQAVTLAKWLHSGTGNDLLKAARQYSQDAADAHRPLLLGQHVSPEQAFSDAFGAKPNANAKSAGTVHPAAGSSSATAGDLMDILQRSLDEARKRQRAK